MRIRKRCMRKGHKWFDPGFALPFEMCTRWFCDGERVSPDFDMPDELRWLFEQFLIQKMREDNKT